MLQKMGPDEKKCKRLKRYNVMINQLLIVFDKLYHQVVLRNTLKVAIFREEEKLGEKTIKK